jgi:hypothetical protein
VNAKGLMLLGIGMAALGGILTLASQSNAEQSSDGTYIVFTGLLVVGGFNFLRGLFYYLRER